MTPRIRSSPHADLIACLLATCTGSSLTYRSCFNSIRWAPSLLQASTRVAIAVHRGRFTYRKALDNLASTCDFWCAVKSRSTNCDCRCALEEDKHWQTVQK